MTDFKADSAHCKNSNFKRKKYIEIRRRMPHKKCTLLMVPSDS